MSASVACNQFRRIGVRRQHVSVELTTLTTVACKRELAVFHTVTGSRLRFDARSTYRRGNMQLLIEDVTSQSTEDSVLSTHGSAMLFCAGGGGCVLH